MRMCHITKHLMIFCTLLAMLWAQVFGLQFQDYVCACSDEPIVTTIDHCHDSPSTHHQAVTEDHHEDHDCDQQQGETQQHAPLKKDLKARTQLFTQVSLETPVFAILFVLPTPLVLNPLSTSAQVAGSDAYPIQHSLPLSLRVHQSVVFLI